MIWSQERSGKFSVKSCYRLFKNQVQGCQGECSNERQQQSLWKAIWNMRVPNKIKVFAWRACKELLPSQQNLLKKHVDVEVSCCFCKQQVEDIGHALFHCLEIHSSWFPYFPFIQHLGSNLPVVQIALEVLKQGQGEDLSLFFAIAWRLWWRRNQMVHEKKNIAVQQVIDYALSVRRAFSDLKCLPMMKVREYFDWKPPPSGWLKLNVDGAVFSNIHKAGVGLILRDEARKVLLAASKVDSEVSNVEAIELLAIFRALQLVASMGIQRLLVESDCLKVVQVLNNEIVSDALLGPLLSEIRKLSSVFAYCLFQHVYREGNRVAHVLARYAWNVGSNSMWNVCCPDFISQAIWLDNCL